MKDKVVLVTGAGHPRGIGRTIALTMAQEGADLVLVDVDIQGARAIGEEIRALGRRALAVQTDVSSDEQVNAMAEVALAEYGRIDVLVNNVGVNRYRPILEITSEEWDWIMSVNVKSAFLCTKAVLPAMIRQGGGRIISLSSWVGHAGAGMKNGIHYATSKAAIMGFTKSVARQVGQYGITSNAVAPGAVDTDLTREYETHEEFVGRRNVQVDQTPLGRIATTQDIADAILFLASDRASFITGEVLDVNGGLYMN